MCLGKLHRIKKQKNFANIEEVMTYRDIDSPSTPRRSVGGNHYLKKNTSKGRLGNYEQELCYGSYQQSVMSSTESPAYLSLLTESIPSTRLEKILSVGNGSHQWTVVQSTERHPSLSIVTVSWRRKHLKNFVSVKRRKAAMVRCGLDGPLVRSSTQTCFWADFP